MNRLNKRFRLTIRKDDGTTVEQIDSTNKELLIKLWIEDCVYSTATLHTKREGLWHDISNELIKE